MQRLLLTIPVSVALVDTFGYIARVDGESMKPTLNSEPNVSEYVFLNKYKARNYEVERGDIVCLISPKDPSQRIIKRVIALENDTVETFGFKERFVKVSAGHFWVEGDNYKNSLDSNIFGDVPVGLLTAIATHVVWPPRSWRRLPRAEMQPKKRSSRENQHV